MLENIEYKGKNIVYTVYKKDIKNLYIRINRDGVIVTASKKISNSKIKEFVNSKASWIFKNLEQEEKRKKINKKYISEENFKVFGNDYILKVYYDEKYDNRDNIDDLTNTINIYLPKIYENCSNDIKISEISKTKVNSMYYSLLDSFLKIAICKYQTLTGLHASSYNIKKMKSAWGRCSYKKNISINIDLAMYSKNAIESVVLHEICHLKYMNHSKQFWNLVKTYMSDYDDIKKELKCK